MQTTPDLDVDDVALGGWQLVEANAGTGKTWALEQLYRRLVEEAGIPVESILVMTFTRAATAELRGRIAGTLGKRIAGIAADDPARERLERARADMDLAAIHTIHGFCQRALDDHAFAAGQPLAREAAPTLASAATQKSSGESEPGDIPSRKVGVTSNARLKVGNRRGGSSTIDQSTPSSARLNQPTAKRSRNW